MFLAACGSSPTSIAENAGAQSTSYLWFEQDSSRTDPLRRAFVEVELAARGETTNGTYYLGRRTASAFRKSLYARQASASNSDLKNCSDFSTSAQAQRFFLQSGGPISDDHNLDGDGDGLACEWGTKISRIAKRAHRKAIAKSRRTYRRSTCYVGPRGGTYTLTASGNKNYNGC